MLNQTDLIKFLRNDVAPALGCTEPVCVALCAANAAKHMNEAVQRIEVIVNPNIYKNGMSAGIPNSDQVGLERAAALGACLKNPERSLELLADVNDEIRREADAMIAGKNVNMKIDTDQSALYVCCKLYSENEDCTCIIQNAHTNVVLIEKNGKIKLSKEATSSGSDSTFVDALVKMKISEIRALVDSMAEEDLLFMLDGVEMNERLAGYSIDHGCGVGIADTLRRLKGSDLLADGLMSRIQLLVAAAAENRLDGCPYPTMSSSGAGTKGLVVILPISETAKAVRASREMTVKALAFGHCVNRYINAYIGKLAPMCSCAMASSTAACAAMTWLLGGSDEQIAYAIRNMTGTITGMICDGGKVGCALKVATSSAAALLCAITAANNAVLRVSDGICAESPEDCIRNIARIGNPGMLETDREILSIMLEKQ